MIAIKTLINDDVFIKRTQIFLTVLFVILVLWDFLLALDCLDMNTISRVIQNKVDSGMLVLTYFWGAVCANIFFPLNEKPKIGPITGTIILYGIALLFIIMNAEEKVGQLMESDIYKQALGMAFGFLVGLVVWRQKQ